MAMAVVWAMCLSHHGLRVPVESDQKLQGIVSTWLISYTTSFLPHSVGQSKSQSHAKNQGSGEIEFTSWSVIAKTHYKRACA